MKFNESFDDFSLSCLLNTHSQSVDSLVLNAGPLLAVMSLDVRVNSLSFVFAFVRKSEVQDERKKLAEHNEN